LRLLRNRSDVYPGMFWKKVYLNSEGVLKGMIGFNLIKQLTLNNVGVAGQSQVLDDEDEGVTDAAKVDELVT
jgi:hypothetical protein